MEPFVLPVFLAALAKQLTNLVAFVTAQDWKAVAKQLIAYVAGIGGVALVKLSDFAPGFTIPGVEKALGDWNGAGTVVAGLLLGAFAGTIQDFINSRDGLSTSHVPELGGPKPPPA